MCEAPYCEIEMRRRDGSVAAVAKVSPEDVPLLGHRRWKLTAKGYAQREQCRDGKWTSERMHRLVMGLGAGDPRQVDHRNRDKLDNRRENLRIVSAAEQAHNVPSRQGTSAHRGVHRHAATGKWAARVARVHLGLFETEQEAAAAAKAGRALHLAAAVD